MSTLGGYHEYTRGYRDKYGGRSLGKQLNLYGNPSVLNIPRFTHDIPPHSLQYPPVYSWYPLVYWTTLLYSWYHPHSSWYPQLCSWCLPTVLNTHQCTQWYPPVYGTSPREHPPGVLHRHYAGWVSFIKTAGAFKGPVKLIQRVKIAHSFLKFVSSLFHYYIKLAYVVLHMAVKELFETQY